MIAYGFIRLLSVLIPTARHIMFICSYRLIYIVFRGSLHSLYAPSAASSAVASVQLKKHTHTARLRAHTQSHTPSRHSASTLSLGRPHGKALSRSDRVVRPQRQSIPHANTVCSCKWHGIGPASAAVSRASDGHIIEISLRCKLRGSKQHTHISTDCAPLVVAIIVSAVRHA
jgi:hypothetical protein